MVIPSRYKPTKENISPLQKLLRDTSSHNKKTPAILLTNRELRTKMPRIQQTLKNLISTDVNKTDADSKQTSKSLADKKRIATLHLFKKGEMALLH